MSRDKPWLKMWVEWLGDAKMDRLSLAEQGAWWRLVSLTHECGHTDQTGKADGALVVAGTPLSLPEIMKTLKITDEADKATFNHMLEKMKTAGSLHWNSNTLAVIHFEERQRASTDTKEARRQRQHDRRERLKADQEKREPEKSPSPKEPEEDSKRREGEEEHHAQTSNRKSVTISELSRCYEQYIGLINPLDADRMREFTEYYERHGGKIDWIEKAFKNAPVNKRRWPYVQAILERYIEEGGPDGRAGREEDGRRGADETDRRGSVEPTKRHQWKVKRSGPAPNPGGEEKR